MDTEESTRVFEKNAIEAAIKIGILGTMVVSTVLIIRPFLIPVIWGIIIAVAVEPLIARVTPLLGGRRKLASTLFALLVIAALVIPASMLITSSFGMVQEIGERLESDTLVIPPPPAKVEGWPLIGPSLSKAWALAASNLGEAVQQFKPQLKAAALTVLGTVKGGVAAFFMSLISVVIAAALLATAEKGSAAVTKIFSRFAEDRGPEIAALATSTIRGVMLGVVGVAIIQAVLAGIGMSIVGVPGAAIWTMLILICAVIQLPPLLILGPVAGYVFTFADTTPAVIFLVWAVLISMSDAFLKPLLMGRGVDIPMLVILIGALGGMVLFGIIGLFVGAVAVAIMYTLFLAWLDEKDAESQATS